MAIEKKWLAIPPRLMTANGTSDGTVTISTTKDLRVKMRVVLQAPAIPPTVLQVKQIISQTQFKVGPFPSTQLQGKTGLSTYSDVSVYTVAAGSFIFTDIQDKSIPKSDDIDQAVYEQEPVVALRNVLVDQFGNFYDSVQDSSGLNRLAVDGQFHAEVDVQVDVDVDGYYDPTNNPDPDNIGLIGHTRSTDTDQTDQVQRVTAKRGTLDTDTVAMDVSLHDQNGNAFTAINPVPVSTTYEKFFSLIAASRWMKLANYDEVTPSFVGSTLTLTYKEDGAFLGEAVVTNYDSLTGWSLKLNRYIDDDDGTIILDDNGSPLNLD